MTPSRRHAGPRGGRSGFPLAIALLSLLVVPAAASPDCLRDVLQGGEVDEAIAFIDASGDRAVDSLVSLASIVSPSGQERERALWLADRMRAIGLEDVRMDAESNVVGRIRGRSDRAIIFITTLDDLATIAELQRASERPPERQGDRVLGPATELQSMNAAVLLAAEALVRARVIPPHDVVFAAVTQEETGLIGMSALFDAWNDRADAWVDVLGDGQEIVYGAGAVHWWKVVANGRSGHTAQTDLPNANLGIARAVDRILALPRPDRSDGTFISVGIIESGQLYNHKPSSGWFSLDLRSLELDTVLEIEADVADVLEGVQAETGVSFVMEPVVTLDGGQLPGARESRLVRLATEVSRHLGGEPLVSAEGCCNMSIPVSHGRFAIGLHGTRGGGRASPEEWSSVPAMIRTAKHVTLLAAAY